jgi:hypothetical protein
MTNNPPSVNLSIPIPALDSITRTIYCQNSGVVLGNLEVKIFEGQLAYLEAHSDALYLHPFYRLNSIVLIKKLEDCLHRFQEQGWLGSHPEQLRLRLLTSAMMFNLDSIKQSQTSLPSFAVAAASAGRLLGISKWFFYVSSQRLAFPTYSVSKLNDNLEWQNFKHWIDSAYQIRQDWSSKSKELKRDAEQKAMSESLREIKSEHYRRIDTKKVWNWIWLQLEDKIHSGRIETFKNLFLNGDVEAHEWIIDDVDDLREATLLHCDTGNEIMFFIKKRLDGIAALVRDFYSSFTIVSRISSENFGTEGGHTPEEALFFSEFDIRAQALEAMPEPPKREDFTSLGLFLKAQAQWNILSKRFKQLKGEVK